MNRSQAKALSILGTHIVVGPSGINIDVLAHELSHVEIVARVGYWQWRRISNRFDEGLAVQADYRYPLLSLEQDNIRMHPVNKSFTRDDILLIFSK